MLPAVQSAREAARRLQCTNNLKQIGLACLTHEQIHKFLPTSGWGRGWAGEPTRGFDKRQPGGWHYNILPYLELQALHDLGIDQGIDASQNRPGFARRYSTAVGGFICPSRRKVTAYPYWQTSYSLYNANPRMTTIGRSDYAISGGDTGYGAGMTSGPYNLNGGDGLTEDEWKNSFKAGMVFAGWYTTGISHVRSMVQFRDIADGVSKTYLVGEKFCDPDHYNDGLSNWDDEGWDSAWDWDTVRWSGSCQTQNNKNDKGQADLNYQPTQDTPRQRNGLVLWQPAFRQLQYGFLRRIGPCDQLFDRSRNPPPPRQQGRQPADRHQGVLARIPRYTRKTQAVIGGANMPVRPDYAGTCTIIPWSFLAGDE